MADITYADVAVSLGRPISTTDEIQQVEWYISGALIQIKGRLGDPDLLDQADLKYVVVEAVATKMTNPEGYQYESIDDYRYGRPAESRRVTIVDEWWQLLDPNSSQPSGSIRPGFEPDTARWAVQTPPYTNDDLWRFQ